jgi:tetratricopeptide (TPR) repeat protein
VFRITAALLVPGVLLGGTELALRVGGYGVPQSFTVRSQIGGTTRTLSNPYFFWKFSGPALARRCIPFVLSEEKEPGTCRIFVLGGSAARGDPAPSYSIARLLDVMLRARYPRIRFEVINTGATAINSHVVLPIARACADLHADLLVLYLGNNEVVGPFGAGSVIAPDAARLSVIRAGLAMKSSRLVQLIQNTSGRWSARSLPVTWGGMEMFLDRQVRADDPELERMYRFFRQNLRDILDDASRAGVPIVCSTVAVNLKDCAPFASAHRADITEADRERCAQLLDEAQGLLTEAQHLDARARLQAAEHLDPQFANTHFLLGWAHAELGEFTTARAAFEKARDLDVLRFRADTKINAIIREAAGSGTTDGVYLTDAEMALAQAVSNGIVGGEMFYDHVHLNFRGGYEVARALLPQVEAALQSRLAASSDQPVPSMDECAVRLAYTDVDRFLIAREMSARMANPPFSNQRNHGALMAGLAAEIEQRAPTEVRVQHALDVYAAALVEPGAHYLLHWRLGQIHWHVRGDYAMCERHWNAVLAACPQYAEVYFAVGQVHRAVRRFDLAEACMARALTYMPASAGPCKEMGIIQLRMDRPRAAEPYLIRALAIDPHDAETHFVLADALRATATADADRRALARAHLEKARNLLQQAVDESPASVNDHFGLARVLAEMGDRSGAITHLEEVVRLNPYHREARQVLSDLRD